MTSVERVAAALAHRQPDRTPWFEYVLLSPAADTLLGRPYIDYRGQEERWNDAVREMGFDGALARHVDDRLELAQYLDHDLLYVPPNPPPGTRAGHVAAATEGALAADDPVAAVRAVNQRMARRLESPEDAGTFRVFEMLTEQMARRGREIPILAAAYHHGIWTDIDLMQAMVLEPDAAHERFALATRRVRRLIERFAALGVRQVGVGGDFASNAPLISAECYRTFIMPEVARCSAAAHDHGMAAVIASDGNLWYVIEDFLLGTGADAYLEIDAHAGMELPRLKREFGDRITFYGNIDCGNLLTRGTPEQIRTAARRCLEEGTGNGGHLFTASNAITESVPPLNYLALVNGYREAVGLPAVTLRV